MGVACIADDILIYGIGDTLDDARQDHDKNLSLLLERCRQKSVKLNRHSGAEGTTGGFHGTSADCTWLET